MTKIEILDAAIEGVESGKYKYSWTRSTDCNCGIISQIALGMEPHTLGLTFARTTPIEAYLMLLTEVRENGKEERVAGGPWTHASKYAQLCSKTGESVQKIFKDLTDMGFTYKELTHLENLSNPQVLARLNWDTETCHRSSQSHFVEYLKAWKTILEEAQPEFQEWKKLNTELSGAR